MDFSGVVGRVHCAMWRTGPYAVGLRFACPTLLAVLCVTSTATAQTQRHLEAVLPHIGQRGTTVDVAMQGMYLADPQQVLFYRPGILAIDVRSLPELTQFDPMGKLNTIDKRIGGRAFGGVVKEQAGAKFVIAPDCPIGLHPLRLRTAKDLSTLSFFWVTPYPVVKEAEAYESNPSNTTIATAEVLPPGNVSVYGYISTGPIMDRDTYRITRKKGERISVEVNSVRMSWIFWARGELDLVARILDGAGNELALADDSPMHVQDPMISILAPADGDYFIEIGQSLFNDTYNSFYQHYVASISDKEMPLAIYPAGGPVGTELDVTLIGDSQGDRTAKVSLPAVSGDYPHDFGGSYPLAMRVSKTRNVLEGANGAISDGGELPVALNGIVSRPNEVDEFRFTPKMGQAYLVRTYARSLGTPLDPVIEIRHEQSGEIEATGDDVGNYEERGLPGVPNAFRRLSIMDPSVVWTPKKPGPYVLKMQDIRNQGAPTCVYRVEIEPVENRMNTYLVSRNYSRESPRDSGTAIPRGNRWTIQLGLSQGQGNPYRGDLELYAEGLPAEIEMIAPPVKAVGGAYPTAVPIQFVARPDAPTNAVLFRVLARPMEAGVDFHSSAGQAIIFVGDHFGQSSNSLIVDQFSISAVHPAPFSIEVETPKIPLIQDGELSVKVKLHRQPGFDLPIHIVSAWNPNGVGSEPTMEIPPGISEAVYRFTATSNAAPATWKVAIQARTPLPNPKDVAGAGQTQISSAFFDLTVAQPYVKLVSEPVAIRRGANASFVWKVNPQHPFKAAALAKLQGLPKGIKVAEPGPVLTPDAAELVFELQADAEALLGQYKEIGVELTFREEGQEIRQRTGAGVLRIDPALQK